MSYKREEQFLRDQRQLSFDNSASSSEDEEIDYEQQWTRGGPQGANDETCDVPCCSTPNDRVQPVQTLCGTQNRCYNHRSCCTLLAE
ncbi:hypothetical protein GBAR_LOCUS12165 [Geodia barretti]|uniref:Uncharacterized protein n=1 Tax=Geodia barretti TaxID=519541 RepID=A0AA35WGA2_GEOBA|nr:hypothetical protein GBAR_LOCUS12165 [Geodia barretti]